MAFVSRLGLSLFLSLGSTVGYRSGKLAQDLVEKKLDAYNLKGSILAWTHASLPLTDRYEAVHGSANVGEGSCGDPEGVKRVHTYSQAWAMQADGYEAVRLSLLPFKAPSVKPYCLWISLLGS